MSREATTVQQPPDIVVSKKDTTGAAVGVAGAGTLTAAATYAFIHDPDLRAMAMLIAPSIGGLVVYLRSFINYKINNFKEERDKIKRENTLLKEEEKILTWIKEAIANYNNPALPRAERIKNANRISDLHERLHRLRVSSLESDASVTKLVEQEPAISGPTPVIQQKKRVPSGKGKGR